MFGILRTPSDSIFRHRMPPTAPSVRYSAGAKRCEGEDGAEMVRRLLPSFSFSLIAAGCRYGDDRLKVLGIFLMILVGVLNVSCPVPSMDSSTLSALISAGESGSAVGAVAPQPRLKLHNEFIYSLEFLISRRLRGAVM